LEIDRDATLTTSLSDGVVGIGFSEAFDVNVGGVGAGDGKARGVVEAGSDFPVGLLRAGGKVSSDACDLTGCALSFELKVGEEKVCALGELDSVVCSSSEGLFGEHSRKDWRGVGGQRSDGGGSGQKDDLSGEHVVDEWIVDRWIDG